MILLSEVVKELLEAEYLELSEASRESLGAVLIKLEFSIQVSFAFYLMNIWEKNI